MRFALLALLLLAACAAPPEPGPEPPFLLPGVRVNPAWGEWYRAKVAYDRATQPLWPIPAVGSAGNPVFVHVLP